MSAFWWGLIIGLMFGGSVGAFLMAILAGGAMEQEARWDQRHAPKDGKG